MHCQNGNKCDPSTWGIPHQCMKEKRFLNAPCSLLKWSAFDFFFFFFYELLPLKALRGGGFLLINLTTAVLSVRYWNQTIANPSKVAGRESMCLLHNTESTARSCMCSHSRLLAHSRNRCNKQFSDIYVYIYIILVCMCLCVSEWDVVDRFVLAQTDRTIKIIP